MRGEGSVAGKGRLVDVPKFHSWGNKHSRFDVHCFLWPVCYINGASLSETHTSTSDCIVHMQVYMYASLFGLTTYHNSNEHIQIF